MSSNQATGRIPARVGASTTVGGGERMEASLELPERRGASHPTGAGDPATGGKRSGGRFEGTMEILQRIHLEPLHVAHAFNRGEGAGDRRVVGDALR